MDSTEHALRVHSLAVIISIVSLLLLALVGTVPRTTHAASLHYHFKVPGVLQESGSMGESTSPYFWLNSGGQLILKDGVGATVHGALSTGTLWNTLYAAANSLDTNGGAEPQNLFRLVTKSQWTDLSEEVRFKIDDINTTDTPNRDGYSGILLMSRYQNGDNLYYAGIRMDGDAVIKKKKGGSYTTLAQEEVFSGSYHRDSNPNLIPEHKWMRLKTVTRTLNNGDVEVSLYLDETDSGSWKKILSAVDRSNPITGRGYAGIRTDYMDASFDDYKMVEL